MTRYTATVLSAGRETIPNTDSEEAWRVYTDLPDRAQAGLYIDLAYPCPAFGTVISYGDRHADYIADGRPVRARVRDYHFDPDAALA